MLAVASANKGGNRFVWANGFGQICWFEPQSLAEQFSTMLIFFRFFEFRTHFSDIRENYKNGFKTQELLIEGSTPRTTTMDL